LPIGEQRIKSTTQCSTNKDLMTKSVPCVCSAAYILQKLAVRF
jgi:hypothetical protein